MKTTLDNIEKEVIRDALVNWLLRIDDCDGAIGEVINTIPFGKGDWEDWHDAMDSALGACTNWDINSLVATGDDGERNRVRFHNEVDTKLNSVCEAWEKYEKRVYESAEERIRKIEGSNITGYLLEYLDEEKNEWFASEFDPLAESNKWNSHRPKKEDDAWYDNDTPVGFFTELGADTWLGSSDDWNFRLGVDFDARYTPNDNPSPVKIWGGWSESQKCLWRVRKVTIKGTLSETAKEFFREFPDVWMTFNVKEGE